MHLYLGLLLGLVLGLLLGFRIGFGGSLLIGGGERLWAVVAHKFSMCCGMLEFCFHTWLQICFCVCSWVWVRG